MEFSEKKIVGSIKIEKAITEADIETIIVNGFETGCGYWATLDKKGVIWDNKPKDVPSSEWSTKILLDGGKVYLFDDEEGDRYELTLQSLLKGIELNAKNRPHDCNIDNGDAITYDCIIQYALFGDVIYG